VDRANRLLITNDHVLGLNNYVEVFFPEHSRNKLIDEPRHYLKKLGRGLRGEFVVYDVELDLAVIQLSSVPAEAVELKLATVPPKRDDPVHLVGNPGKFDRFWLYNSGTVLYAGWQQFKNRDSPELRKAYMLELKVQDKTTAKGASGGPVVDGEGRLVGVVQSGDYTKDRVRCIEVREVRRLLERARRLMNPQVAADYVERGLLQAGKKRFENAAEEYKRALARDPNNAAAYRGRGEAYRHRQMYDHAVADCTEAVRLNPKDPHAYRARGAVYRHLREYTKALADYDVAIRLDLRDARPRVERAGILNLLGHHGIAIGDLNAALRLLQAEIDSLGAWAAPAEREQLVQYQAAAYRECGIACRHVGLYDTALKNLDYALRRNARDAAAYRERGLTYFRRGDCDRAIADYTRALSLDGQDGAAYRERAVAFNHKRDYFRALNDCSEAIRFNPKDAVAHRERGRAYYHREQYGQAMDDFNAAIRLDPKDAAAYRLRGLANLARGEPDKAVADYTEALRVAPRDAEAYWGRSKVYGRLGRTKDARADVQSAVYWAVRF
jgi:tetratricopeptide (TPR) repeat protein